MSHIVQWLQNNINKLGLSWAKLSSKLWLVVASDIYSQLQLVVASGQLVICWTASLIVLIEYTNFHFCTILIRLEIAEIAIASGSQWIASDQLEAQSYCTC